MNEDITVNEDGVEQIALKSYTQSAYLNYAMYVITETGPAKNCLCHVGTWPQGFSEI